MLLAIKDIRFNRMRFLLTVAGLTAMVTMTLALNGLYRGVSRDSLIITETIGADAWLVQRGRDAPFNDDSTVSPLLDRRAEGVPGVREARRFMAYGFRLVFGDRIMRMTILGLDFPKDRGDWIPLIAGRALGTSRYEMIVDKSIGLSIGERLRLGRDEFTVVGVSLGQVDLSGDGLVFVSFPDAQSIVTNLPSEAVLLSRAMHGAGEPRIGSNPVQAVVVKFVSAASESLLRERISTWGDVTMVTNAEQERAIIMGRLWRLRVQILAFVILMYIICGAMVALTIFTVVLENLKTISLLKLVGASDFYVSFWIIQYAIVMAGMSFLLAVAVGLCTFDLFPRSVILLPWDIAVLGGSLFLICVLSSAFSVSKAIQVRANEALS
jgi:putative ABC transport system permease protein